VFVFAVIPVMSGDVVLAGFCGVMVRVRRVPMGRVRVMRSGFVLSVFMMFRRFAVVPRCMFVMFGRRMMVFRCRVRVVHLILCGVQA
jgi:hypothetical protein